MFAVAGVVAVMAPRMLAEIGDRRSEIRESESAFSDL